ncbi:MAG: hypothetical protein GXP26_05885, partial [Planctomycetes bacterium]|nr:hypothetical protein [Planctomycetota bacterium]
NPFRVLLFLRTITQGGAASPLTLGYDVQPLWGSRLMVSRLVGPDLELLNDEKLIAND